VASGVRQHAGPRLWSLDEANAALAEAVALLRHAQDAMSRAERAVERIDAESQAIAEAAMHAAVARLLEMGIEVKGLRPGLLDFRSRLGDRVVHLCWREGEDTIAYWHTLEEGYAGRRPIPAVQLPN
jgi:hypothetical protein